MPAHSGHSVDELPPDSVTEVMVASQTALATAAEGIQKQASGVQWLCAAVVLHVPPHLCVGASYGVGTRV